MYITRPGGSVLILMATTIVIFLGARCMTDFPVSSRLRSGLLVSVLMLTAPSS